MKADKWVRGACLVLIYGMILSIFATAVEPLPVGEVLYHQDFYGIGNLRSTGIQIGSASSDTTKVKTDGENLRILTYDDLRNYVLLPEMPWSEDYTIEFSFRFDDVRARNGYLAFLLTCWGEAPSNITGFVIRASGSIDEFAPLSEDVRNAIKAGEDEIHVTIPVENGILYEATVSVGDVSDTVKRASLKRIPEGNRGFGVRNTSATVSEIYVVNGVGYTAKTGDFAAASWSDDPENLVLTDAPDTGEPIGCVVGMTVGLVGVLMAKRTRKQHET